MKIALVVPEEVFGTRHGGVTSYTLDLASYLNNTKNIAIVICPGNKTEIIRYKNITIQKIEHISFLKSYTAKILRRLYGIFEWYVFDRILWSLTINDFLHKNKFDIVECPEWGASALCINQSKINVVIKIHRSWYQYLLDNNIKPKFNDTIIAFLEYVPIIFTKNISAPTNFILSTYPSILWKIKRIIGHRMIVISNGVDIPKMKSQPINENQLIYSGRIEIAKGVITLLDAFTTLPREFSKIKLFIIGEDTERIFNTKRLSFKKYLLKKYEKNLENIFFVEKLSRPELFKIISKSSILICPSLGNENQPMSLLEGISLGKPVIASRTGGIKETIKDGINGLLFEAGNPEDLGKKIILLLKSKTLRKNIESYNKKNVEQFSINSQGAKIIKYYKNILSS